MDSFRSPLDEYLLAISRDRGLSDSTLNKYRDDLKLFSQWASLQGLGLAEVQQADVLAFLSHLLKNGHASKAVSRTLSRLHAFYAYYVVLGRLNNNPAAGVTTLS